MKNVRGGIRTEDQSGAEQVQDHGGESWWEQQQPPRPAADLRSHYEARGLSAECVQGQAQPLFISHCRLLRVCTLVFLWCWEMSDEQIKKDRRELKLEIKTEGWEEE